MINNDDKKDIDDKLFTVKYRSCEQTHLIVDSKKCQTCVDKPCLHICPANVYTWDDEKSELMVAHENCLECGACRIFCEKNAIDWSYPPSGYGVTFKYG